MRAAVLLIIFFIFIILPGQAREYALDENGDGKPDQWFEMTDGIMLEQMSDRNYDGVVDYIARFSKKGHKLYEEYDYNYDGKMDDFYYYEKGALIRHEIDSNFDGNIDIWINMFESVYIKRYEVDYDHDGNIDKIIDYSD
jgi:hypothetical protein